MSATMLRIPAGSANAVAAKLMTRWRMDAPACLLVGSLRRGHGLVGDIDLVAPMPTGKVDPLYDLIAADMKADGLWGAGGGAEDKSIGRALSGLKPGFRCASLAMRLSKQGDPQGEIAVQISRYDAGEKGNKGWITIIRTGPADFGPWFLSTWKKRFDIPREREASREGYLLDRAGRALATPEEADCFTLLGMPFLPPAQRDEIAKGYRS